MDLFVLFDGCGVVVSWQRWLGIQGVGMLGSSKSHRICHPTRAPPASSTYSAIYAILTTGYSSHEMKHLDTIF